MPKDDREYRPPEHHIHHTLLKIKGLEEKNPGPVNNEMIHAFAFLLSKLAEQANASSNRMLRMTRWIIVLTVLLALIAVLQLFLLLSP